MLIVLLFSLIFYAHGSQPAEFEGRKVLIIGASSGMGKATADLIYERGGSVVYTARSLDKMKAHLVGKDSKRVLALKCDAGVGGDIKNAVDEAAKFMGGLDGLLFVPTWVEGPFAFKDAVAARRAQSDLSSAFKWNVLLFVESFECALPYLLQSKHSSVASISSIAVEMTGLYHYSATKAALESMTKSLAKEYIGQIRVNTFRVSF